MATETAEQINSKASTLNRMIKQREVFDPRIIDVEDSNKALWTSESVELANKGLMEGFKLKENPYLKTVKGALLRKPYLPFKYAEEEMEILEAVIEDKEFFCDNFGKLKEGDKGWVNIKLRDYQRRLLNYYTNNKWNIVMFPRQSGKTTTTVLEIVHFCISNFDKDCVVIAQSDKVVNEILAKIKECFAGLPFFMQPGFISFNKKGFVLDNGCRLSIGIASESVVQGFSLDLLYIDEFAYIKPSLVRTFWNNIYPSLINNPNSRCIITSTPNGRNMFWELWQGSINKTNRFVNSRIYWNDVPGRDEQFKLDTIANLGIEGWLMGFECSFDTQLKSIFHSTVQVKLRENQLNAEKEWDKSNNYLGNKFQMDFISQQKIKYDLLKDWFILTIDLAEGLEQDSTVAKLRKINWDIISKKLKFESVGVFKDNTIAIEDFAQWVMDFSKYFDKNKFRIVVENNTYGGEFFSQVKALKLYDPNYSWFDNIVFAKFHRKSKEDFEYGIRWDGNNKKTAVKSFSNLISTNILCESHSLSIEEYLNFGRQPNGSYAAQYGHDDLVMADVSLSHFVKCNNIYANEFLDKAKTELRLIYNDEDIETKRQKEEALRKQQNKFKHNGFELRDHQAEYNKRFGNNDDLFLFDMN